MEDFRPRLRAALERLPEQELWWRPNEASNSAGNLVLHLCGNARQWVLSGVVGEPDRRDRDAEFAERGGLDRAALLAVVEESFGEIDRALRALDPARLLEPRRVQGTDVTVLEALLHVVEHVSHHVGQVIWIVKARTGADLGLWRVEDGVAAPTWRR